MKIRKIFESIIDQSEKIEILRDIIYFLYYHSNDDKSNRYDDMLCSILDEKIKDNMYPEPTKEDIDLYIDDFMRFSDDDKWFNKLIDVHNKIRKGSNLPRIKDIETILMSYSEGGFNCIFDERGISNNKYSIKISKYNLILNEYIKLLYGIESKIKNRIDSNLNVVVKSTNYYSSEYDESVIGKANKKYTYAEIKIEIS